MRNRPDWMSNTDVLIVLALGSSDLVRVLTPTVIAYNLDLSRPHVSRRLAEMVERDFVVRVDEGKYELDDRGRSFLDGELGTQ